MSSNLRTWVSWCNIHELDPVTCSISKICDFFTEMLSKSMAFHTIAGYRTAISEVHEHVNGSPIGVHPDISRIMHAIHIENPPPVRSDEPVNITPSLDYIRELGDNSSMSIR